MLSRRNVLKIGGTLAASTMLPSATFGQAGRTITISTTGIITSVNPLAHSSAHLYSVWGQIYGTFTRYNYVTQTLEPYLAESWEPVDDTRWRVKLNQKLTRHDGGPAPTARDAVHSFNRIATDPASQQAQRLVQVFSVEEFDETTFDVITKTPFALFPSEILTRVTVMSADLYDELGTEADSKAPFGWGPYELEDFNVDSQIVIRRSQYWPDAEGNRAEVAIFRQILEPEQRVTAILNNEVQIARLIPPQMIDRVTNQPGVDRLDSGGLEYMFLAMNVNHKPWDDVRVRQAAAHAVDRKLIVDRILFGLADLMDSAIGPFQDCHTASTGFPQYDPDRSRALLAEAGYADGIDVDFYTASGRYVSDRQIGEAVAQMLGEVGFRVNLQAPDYANFTQMVQKGDCPFYYTGRAGSNSSLDNLPQFFETGGSPRIGYSNSQVDALFAAARGEFEEEARCDLLRDAADLIVSEAPALFMWTHKLVQAKRSDIDWVADANGEVWVDDITIN